MDKLTTIPNGLVTAKNSFELSKVGDRYDFLIEYARILILIRDGVLLTKIGNEFAEKSKANYKSHFKRLVRFCKKTGRETIFCDELDFYFFEEYRQFWMQEGMTKNSIASIMANIRSVARRLHREGKAPSFGEGVVSTFEIVTAIFLTVEELKVLAELDLSHVPGLSRSRDMFLLHSFFGLRVGDMFRFLLSPDLYLSQKRGKLFVEYKTHKTGEVVWIPVAASVRPILEKYLGQKTKISTQLYNRNIKDIIELSGLDRDIEYSRTEGGKRIDRTVRFSSLVTSHTARRTFATNAFLAGVDPLNIMKVTGHRTYQSFVSYIRCSNLQAAEQIAQHEFFETNWL